MVKLSRRLLLEVLWLAFATLLSIVLLLLLFGNKIFTGPVDLHLRDTYFVISRGILLITVALFAIFTTYFIKTTICIHTSTFSNVTLLVSGFMLITFLTRMIRILSEFFTGGWTLYPPLSALSPNTTPELRQDETANFVATFLMGIQAVVLGMLLFATYKMKSKSRR